MKYSQVGGGLLALSMAASATGCGEDGPGTSAPACSAKSGTICTWAGTGDPAFDGDGRDRLRTAFYEPNDIEFAPDGRAYVVDWQNHRIRRVNADGKVETVVGTDSIGDGPDEGSEISAPGVVGTTVNLNHPTDLVFLPDGDMLFAAWHNHKIRRYDPGTGLVMVACGSTPGFAGDGGPAGKALTSMPKALALGAAGEVFFIDTRNQRVRKIANDAAGTISTVAGDGMMGFAGDGGAPLTARFKFQSDPENPVPGGGIAIDASGKLYVVDTENHRIRVIDLVAGTVATIAGTGAAGFGGDGGDAKAAQLNYPRDVEIGPDGKLYVADTDNHRVRVVDLATNTITTVAGTGERGFEGDGGSATTALFNRPWGVAFDAPGHLYISDTSNDRIRRVTR